METITINGKTADIIIEGEKTMEDLLRGIDSWLEGAGQFLSGIEVDGASYGSSSMEAILALELENISRVDIKTSSGAELMLEALLGLKNDLDYFMKEQSVPENFTGRAEWETGYAAEFLRQNAPDVYALALQILDKKLSPEGALPLVHERIREIKDPYGEIRVSVPLITETAKRLEDLPLDLQTGKDIRAAETIGLFSGITEKMFRLLICLKLHGIHTESLTAFLAEFAAVVKEFHAAYENRDTVLVGDLAEYELAPKLVELVSRLGALEAAK